MLANKYKHLTLQERIIIENHLHNSKSRTAIAKILGKSKSTICKEVIRHRFVYVNSRNLRRGVTDCRLLAECGFRKRCLDPCERYDRIPCSRRDVTVGVCNGCPIRSCPKTHIMYRAVKAHQAYTSDLVDSRSGVNLSTSQAKHIGDIIQPLIKQGQSPYVIVKNHPELNLSEKTLYNYVSGGVFSQNGLYDIDLRFKTSRKLPKKRVTSKVRSVRLYLKNRTYDDFRSYMAEHPTASIVEMDTVMNHL